MSYVKVAKKSEIPAGSMKAVKLGDKDVLIVNAGGKYYAIGGKCTHRGGELAKGKLEGTIVTCPKHKAQFDAITGKSVAKPKVPLSQPLKDEPVYKVKVEGEDILILQE
ncbi:MAG: Rieske 2Fe-2S domain-containing protein [Candidatus Odinarchaeum yellowstonii]|uniref:Rieske 2Fe-2S domain-containing protein n=1 Tax=Odinarchaeota yellowstonii (strain LCB_4) TaxID=1841599 RepID=A0AAF0IB94_ODILC|nr:MAG: Rieske 2Fe-2S domain-containing protein [Candidatus Odinarchaeum yellowstonii]